MNIILQDSLLIELKKQYNFIPYINQQEISTPYIYGYPIYSIDGKNIIFLGCDYCGEKDGKDEYNHCCKCGAPITGKEYSINTIDEIFDLIMNNSVG